MLLVHLSLQVSNLAEFVALVRKNPNRYSYGSTGIGAVSHLTMEMFKARAGLTLAHAPYRGNPQLIVDLSAGDIQAAFVFVPAALSAVKTGKVKAIAVTGAARNPLAPELPTVAESGLPGFSSVTWFGLFGPRGMSADTVARVHDAFVKVLATPEVVAGLAKLGAEPAAPSSPARFAAMVAEDGQRWGRLIRERKITAE